MADDSFTRRDWLRLAAVVAWLLVFVIWPQLVFSATVLIFGCVLIGFNLWIFWLTVIRKEPASSIAPIFGGLIAAIGIVTLPVTGSWKWAWIPLVIDWGGLPFYLYAKFSTHPSQKIIEQCQLALNSVKDELEPERYCKASDYVSRYDEWLIGLEFAIDWLTDGEISISQESYDEFEKAYRLMDREEDERLSNFKNLVSGSNR